MLLIASWSAQVHGLEDADFVVPETSISEIQESFSSLLPESLEPDKATNKIISQPKQQEQETITLLFTERKKNKKSSRKKKKPTMTEAPTDVPNDAPTDAPSEEEGHDSGSGDSVSTSGIGDEAPTDVPNDAPTDASSDEEGHDSGSGDSVGTSGIGSEPKSACYPDPCRAGGKCEPYTHRGHQLLKCSCKLG